MIRARNVSVQLGSQTLLADVSLDVQGGEVVALFGANGAGKSTLLSVLAGDRRPTSGSVSFNGRDLAIYTSRELAQRRAVLRQKSPLSASYTVEEVVRLGRDDRAVASACLDLVGLAHLAERLYPTLSGGEQQRVHLARVLAQLHDRRDAALFLDEPGAALDLRQQALIEQITRAAASRGHAVILVAHDPHLVSRACDRAVLLQGGRVIADAAPALALAPALLARAFDVSLEFVTTRL